MAQDAPANVAEWLAQAMMRLDRYNKGEGHSYASVALVEKYKAEPWAELSVFGNVQDVEEDADGNGKADG